MLVRRNFVSTVPLFMVYLVLRSDRTGDFMQNDLKWVREKVYLHQKDSVCDMTALEFIV